MTRRGRTLFVAALMLAAGLLGWITGGGPRPLPAPDGLSPVPESMSGEQLLALSFPDASGARRRLGEWRDAVLVVNFWATWCPPCRREIPDFAQVSREYASRGVHFVGLGIDTSDNIARFARSESVPYPLLVAGTGSLPIMSSLGNDSLALPFTLIVGRDGRIAARKLGPMDGASLRKALDAMLAG